jgi:hypothetical protein
MALAMLGGGCAPFTDTTPPVSIETGPPPPATETPTNFAGPTDILHRYPAMRRQIY